MGKKFGFMKKSPLWLRFFSISTLLMFLITLVIITFCITQMRGSEDEVIADNMSSSTYYLEQNISTALLRCSQKISSQQLASEFYDIARRDPRDYRSNIRKELTNVCNESTDIYAVFYRDNSGECYSIGETFGNINSQTELIEEIKSKKDYSKGEGMWRYRLAGRGYNSLVFCKDIIYVDEKYTKNELGTLLIYIDAGRLSAGFFKKDVQISSAACDSYGIIAIAGEDGIIGKNFSEVFDMLSDETALKDGKKYLILKEPSSVPGWEIISYIDTRKTSLNVSKTMNVTIAFAVFGLTVVFILSYFMSKRIGRPVEELLKYIKINRYGEATGLSGDEEEYGDIAKIKNVFEIMSSDLRKNIESNYEMQLKLKEITIKVYESQMNPHFLFNTLQLIQMMNILGEKKNVINITNYLGELLRFNLDSRNEVKLSEEIENAINYLKIMELRFKDRFNYKIMIPQELMECYTVKFMLQPLIENAVTHGFVHKKGSCEISITALQIHEEIAIVIKDNGIGIAPEQLAGIKACLRGESKTSEGIGIMNVHERIQLIYGEKYGIDIFSDYRENTNVLIHIPVSKIPKAEEEKNVEIGDS